MTEQGNSGEPDIFAQEDPFALFSQWLDEATQAEPNDPAALSLATVDPEGMPNVRMVLLKAHGADGFVFYTNFQSTKGRELEGNPRAAMGFHWKSLRRQVRIQGRVTPVSDGEADAYFASRPRGAQIGAWASRQSEVLESRFALEKAVAGVTVRYGVSQIDRPPQWSGFRLVPVLMEFWRDGAFRLHDRLCFRRENPEAGWISERLYP